MSPSSLATRIAERILGPDAASAEEGLSVVRAAHERLAAEMSAVIGKQGFEATFARSVSKTRTAHPHLAEVISGGVAQVYERLWPCLAELPPATILATGRSVFACFFDLMSTFIGADLTLKLFQRTWPDAGLSTLEISEMG
jgi:hypothetical protein